MRAVWTILSLGSFVAAFGCTPVEEDDDGSGGSGASPVIDCPEPTAGPTTHQGSVAADETWTADASPHIVESDMTISAALTLEPCAVVQVAPHLSLTVSVGGTIVANGAETTPVRIGQRDEGQPWAAIRAIGGTLSFTWTHIVGGGDPLNIVPDYQGALDVRGDQTLAPQEILHADHLVIEGSATQGIYLHEGGGFSATSNAVTIKGSTGYPLHSWANLAGTIPAGTYTGNAIDEILIAGQGGYEAILFDTTIHERGVPYRVGHVGSNGELYIGDHDTHATLTIEPGVTMRFKKTGAIYIDYAAGTESAMGTLVAAGTEAAPITFTSAEATPAAGDWHGLRYGAKPTPQNKLDWVTVEYAGMTPTGAGSSSCVYPTEPYNDAAIRMIGPGEPTTVFITNTTVRHSASHAIDRGFISDIKPDFLPTNHFFDIARCNQTYPGPSSAQAPPCPMPPPCPQEEG